jgi:hypothetical protein
MSDSDSGCVSALADDKAPDDLSIPSFLDRTGDAIAAGAAAAETVSKPQSSWRDHLKVHPAADLFPLMSEPELRELGEDIKANGLRSAIVMHGGKLIDGRNRLDAMELVGLKLELSWAYVNAHDTSGDFSLPGRASEFASSITHFAGDPYDFVLSANLHRRHLTSEQKRDLIARVLKAKPEASNRQIAKQVKADDKTVASVRRDLESVAEIPHLEKTVGADGKQYKSRAQKKAPEPLEHCATGSAEIPAEERRAFYEATDPAVVDDRAVEILPPTPKDGNPIWLAWCEAKPSHRREFVKLAWLDIMRARQRDGGWRK